MDYELPVRIYRFSKTEIALEVLIRREDGEFEWSRTGEPYVFHEALELKAVHDIHGGRIVPLEKPAEPPEPPIHEPTQPHKPPPPKPISRMDWYSRWESAHDQ